MRLFLIGKFNERERLRWLREHILTPAGHTVVSAWIDSKESGHDEMSEGACIRQVVVNRREMQEADAGIYLPSWIPSPGRMTDVGMALAFGKPLVLLGVSKWEGLGWFDRSIYLRGAMCCLNEADLPAVLSSVEVLLADGAWP
jgi:hypothetical protein